MKSIIAAKGLIHKFGWWVFCKIGDPIFSPSQAMMGDAVCLWCGRQHGKLTNKSAWAAMLDGLLRLILPEQETK